MDTNELVKYAMKNIYTYKKMARRESDVALLVLKLKIKMRKKIAEAKLKGFSDEEILADMAIRHTINIQEFLLNSVKIEKKQNRDG